MPAAEVAAFPQPKTQHHGPPSPSHSLPQYCKRRSRRNPRARSLDLIRSPKMQTEIALLSYPVLSRRRHLQLSSPCPALCAFLLSQLKHRVPWYAWSRVSRRFTPAFPASRRVAPPLENSLLPAQRHNPPQSALNTTPTHPLPGAAPVGRKTHPRFQLQAR